MTATIRKLIVLCVVLAMATVGDSALAEVTDASPVGFTLVQERIIDAARADVWQAAIDEVGRWWNDDRTISGDAGNLRIDAVLQGCFCEATENRIGVVHMTVTSISPNVMLRLSGGLGPLGLLGVAGNMTWEFFEVDEGTRVRFTYAVGGYSPGGLEELAYPVDEVIGDALNGLKAYVESGAAGSTSID